VPGIKGAEDEPDGLTYKAFREIAAAGYIKISSKKASGKFCRLLF
jgi:hypothetical protein